MRSLQILMPMGGLGQRFQNVGIATPKPLIPVDGMPMFMKAISSFNSLTGDERLPISKVVAIFRQAHQDDFALGELLADAVPGICTVAIEHLTRGSVETCLAGEAMFARDDALVVLDCDLWFRSPRFLRIIGQSLANQGDCSGALTFFEAEEPRYSFVKTEGDFAVDIAEKSAISRNAVIGAYYFDRASCFFDTAKRLLEAPPRGAPEYYVSQVYKELLLQGHRILAVRTEQYSSFGTPEELAGYQMTAQRQPLSTF